MNTSKTIYCPRKYFNHCVLLMFGIQLRTMGKTIKNFFENFATSSEDRGSLYSVLLATV